MRVPLRPPGRWRPAIVVASRRETASARTLQFEVDGWAGHVAGQHIDLRLTAEDGYQATRSYSLSSATGEEPQITVERVDDGEVSPYLVDTVREGYALEVRGPVGAYFVWDASSSTAPVLLMAGGAGVAPLRAIWRSALPTDPPVRLLYSARSLDRLIFAEELCATGAPVTTVHLTREAVPGFEYGRVRSSQVAGLVSSQTRAYVCGPTTFVDDMARALTNAGLDGARLHTERFG